MNFNGSIYLLQTLLGYGYTYEEAQDFNNVMQKYAPVKGEFIMYQFKPNSIESRRLANLATNARLN